MGAKQSRVAMSEPLSELRPEDVHEGETRASILLTPALIDQINGMHAASNTAKQAAVDLNPQYVSEPVTSMSSDSGIQLLQTARSHEEATANGLRQGAFEASALRLQELSCLSTNDESVNCCRGPMTTAKKWR